MEKTIALTNYISSLPRDQREGGMNALTPYYTVVLSDLAEDLVAICEFLDTAQRDEVGIVGHFVATTNNHSRYIMLAVFLAAARLGGISLLSSNVNEIWRDQAVVFARRIPVPDGCLSTTQADRELRIIYIINRLWKHVQYAEEEGPDNAIAFAQQALHQVVDEEVMGISWQRKDPVVLWAVCAAMSWVMLKVENMAQLLLRGDSFKSLYVESEGFEEFGCVRFMDQVFRPRPYLINQAIISSSFNPAFHYTSHKQRTTSSIHGSLFEVCLEFLYLFSHISYSIFDISMSDVPHSYLVTLSCESSKIYKAFTLIVEVNKISVLRYQLHHRLS
jgi:hypothetical protein